MNNWNNYFLEIAKIVASKSKDTTKVGAVIVNEKKEIVSTGYNGFPKNFPEKEENWKKPLKYDYVIHAEANAILFAKTDITNCSIYVTLSPCHECAKLIANSGIKKVYYGEYRHNEVTCEIFNALDIEMIGLKKPTNSVDSSSNSSKSTSNSDY